MKILKSFLATLLLALLAGSPAFATALFTDNYNAADGNLTTGAWAAVNGTLSRYSGVARTTTGTFSVDSIYKATGATFPANTYTQAKVAAYANTSASFILAVRATAGFDAYYCQINSGVIRVTKLVGGTPTVLATSGAYTYTANDVFRCEANGTTLRALINGTQMVTITDSAITAAGDAWLWINSLGTETDVIADDFEAGNFTATAATLSSPTPTGTLGTATTATIGNTTDQASGTYYAVVDSAANLSGVTVTQIKAGQKASGAAALASCNVAVSTTTPSCGVTGLGASTLYTRGAAQNNANGDTAASSGTFTTGASTPTLGGKFFLLQ